MKTFSIENTHIYVKELPSNIESLLTSCDISIQEKVNSISSPRRKCEIVAAHLLIKDIFGEKASIIHDKNGAPLLVGTNAFISISHSTTHIAIAINSSHIIGIDIENWRNQLTKVKSRFLSQLETTIYSTPQLLLRAWTAKEALYKVAQTPGITLNDNIILPVDSHSNIAKVNTANGIANFAIHFIESTAEHCITLALPA